MAVSVCFAEAIEAADEMGVEADELTTVVGQCAAAVAGLDAAVEEADAAVQALKRGRGVDRRPRERRTSPHPDVSLICTAPGVYRIVVKEGSKLQPDKAVLKEATAKAHNLLSGAKKPAERIIVGRSISHIANAIMRSYVGSALPTNSEFEYATTFTKSKIITPEEQLLKCPVPFRNAVAKALEDGVVAKAIAALKEKERFEAVHQAITNGYKSFTQHKSRRLKKLRAESKKRK